MTTIYQRTVLCGHCNASNDIVELGSTNSFGSMDLDMRPPPMERGTLAQQIHRCGSCGFCAPDLEERMGSDSLVGSHEYRALIEDENYPELARKFIAYAFLAESADELVEAASAWRNAAWVCDDHADRYVSASIVCRSEVLRLMKSLVLKGDSFTEDRITDSILELDLLRRSGQHNEVMSCAQALSKEKLPDILKAISAFQQTLAAAGDSRCYTVTNALGDASDSGA